MYCKKCGSQIDDDSVFCSYCGYNLGNDVNSSNKVKTHENNYSEPSKVNSINNGLICPRCGSNDIQTQLLTINKNAGCLTILFYIFLAITLIGIPIMIIILLLRGKKTSVKKHCICQKCGYDFAPNGQKTPQGGIEALIVIGIIAFIALITTPIVVNIINDAKEASNLRLVEAYAKAIEYGVIQYEYDNNGALPSSYCDVKQYVSYTNTDVVCDITITSDEANVIVKHCKVGNYTKHSYRYDGSLKTENRGAEIEEETEFAYPTSCY